MFLHCIAWPAPISEGGWHLVQGGSRSPDLPASWPSLWVPVHGALAMRTHDADWSLHAGQAQLWRGGTVHVRPSSDAKWWCLTAPMDEWNHRFDPRQQGEEPLPWRGEADELLRQSLKTLWSTHDDMAFDALFSVLGEHQRELAAYLPRCRGRTLRHRQQTLLRLLHLHHLMRCHVEKDDDTTLDVAWLAQRAHYSSGHLIRLHRDVFGETPGEYVSRLRDERAWRLVRETDLPVATITHKLGFESQSAFCRAFKHAFGMTTTQARRGGSSACAA